MLDTRFEASRLRIYKRSYGWLWRILTALVLGGTTYCIAIPWAAMQRGYAAFGGEYLLVLAVTVLPFCLFRH